MSVATLLRELKPAGRWTPAARKIYVVRSFRRFFRKNRALVQVALSIDPYNRVLWDGFYRHFYGTFPQRTDTYIEDSKEKRRSWYYNEEVFDPKWDRLLRVYGASKVYREIIRPYLREGGT